MAARQEAAPCQSCQPCTRCQGGEDGGEDFGEEDEEEEEEPQPRREEPEEDEEDEEDNEVNIDDGLLDDVFDELPGTAAQPAPKPAKVTREGVEGSDDIILLESVYS